MTSLRCVLSVQLAALAFTLYSEYEMTAKADERTKRVSNLKHEYTVAINASYISIFHSEFD